MRYCPYCRRWNSGRPQRCHYCGRTWYVRFCLRGHANPPDAQFCGTCGSADLTETAGPRPGWIWLLRLGVLAAFILSLVLLFSGRPGWPELNFLFLYVIAIVLLIIGWNLAVSLLPGPLRRPILSLNRIMKKIALKVLYWCWQKFKLLFT
jgi:hypothetical protein